MSFKRDTTDSSLLRNLKFRRVSEILAQQIPEDEARLLSNGRLTCIVCMHRPIFDNINMLSAHRKGRRHIDELSKYLVHKRELQLKMQKSFQLLELRANSKSPGIKLNEAAVVVADGASSTSFDCGYQKPHPLLTSSPYSSCSKKRNQKIPLAMQRRMVLETPKLTPPSSALVIENSEAPQTPSAHSEVRRYLKGIQRKKPFSKLVEKLKEGYSLPQNAAGSSCVQGSTQDLEIPPSHWKVASSNSDFKPTQDKTLQSATMEHSLKLHMAGWIWEKDVNGGKWVKDPNAEFDSDEEEPPSMN